MGALALDHLVIVGHQRVQLARQRLQLAGIVTLHPLRLPGSHRRHLPSQGEQGPQADTHLQDHRGDQPRAEQNQSDEDLGGEGPHVAINRRPILPRHEHHRNGEVRQAAQQSGDSQGLPFRTGGIVEHHHAGRFGENRDLVRRRGQNAIPQRA